MFLPALLLLVFFATILAFFAIFRLTYWTRRHVPCEPTWTPLGTISKNVLQQKSMADVVNEVYTKFSDEPFFGIFTFLTPALVLKSPELIKEVAVKNVDAFLTHKLFSTGEAAQAFTKNLFSCSGSIWKSTRPSLSPAFTGSKMRAMYTLVNRCAEQWRESMAQDEHRYVDDVLKVDIKEDLFNRFTTDVIATCIFGLESNSFRDRDNEFFTRSIDVSDFIGSKIFALLGYCFNRFVVKLFDLRIIPKEDEVFFSNVVLDTIKIRKMSSMARPDMIQMFMQAQQSKLQHDPESKLNDTGFATVSESALGRQSTTDEITDLDIVGHSMLFLIAGSDTPAIALNFLAFELASNPDVQEKLHAEIKTTMEACDSGQLSYETLMGMTYLDMVCSETLRKWPPLPITDRVAQRPYTIQHKGKRVDLEAGTVVWIPTYSIHRDPEYYPDPEKFDPERFGDKNRTDVKKDFYMPFGIGPRACIGSRLAMLMLKSITVHLLYSFELVPVEKTPNPLELSKKHIFLNPDSRMWLGLKKRI